MRVVSSLRYIMSFGFPFSYRFGIDILTVCSLHFHSRNLASPHHHGYICVYSGMGHYVEGLFINAAVFSFQE